MELGKSDIVKMCPFEYSLRTKTCRLMFFTRYSQVKNFLHATLEILTSNKRRNEIYLNPEMHLSNKSSNKASFQKKSEQPGQMGVAAVPKYKKGAYWT